MHEITDYVLKTTPYGEDEYSTRKIEFFEEQTQIYKNIWIGPLDPDVEESILKACEPSAENFDVQRPCGCAYAFLKKGDNNGEKDIYNFDSDGELSKCIGLSRLVNPTSIGFNYAARVSYLFNEKRMIIPYCLYGNKYLNDQAYILDTNEDWLNPTDIALLGKLLYQYDHNKVPVRIKTAIWFHEVASRNYFVEIWWPLIITGLESLIRIMDEQRPSKKRSSINYVGSREAFVKRLLAICERDPTFKVNKSELKEMYNKRSLYTHGIAIGSLDPASKELYRKGQTLLRKIIMKAILDPSFSGIFVDDNTLRTQLPIY